MILTVLFVVFMVLALVEWAPGVWPATAPRGIFLWLAVACLGLKIIGIHA